MRPSSVLFFSCEAGGAEVLAPIIRLMNTRREYRPIVMGYGHARTRFARHGINTLVVPTVAREDYGALDRFNPDLLITSATSLPTEDMSEKHLWRQARHRGIPSLAFLDQWQNYAVRFSGPEDADHLVYQPDYINCINTIGFEEMQRAGFDPDRLLMLGHPYLDRLAANAAKQDVAAIRTSMDLPGSKEVVLFISEPILEYCGRSRGYDQYSVLDVFLRRFLALPSPPVILVKLHPKDNPARYRQILSTHDGHDIRLLDAAAKPLECILVSDQVFGMSSIMLLESFVLGKKTISIQPNLSVDDPCVLSKYGYIARIAEMSEDSPGGTGHSYGMSFDYKFDVNAFTKVVEQLLDHQVASHTTPSKIPLHSAKLLTLPC